MISLKSVLNKNRVLLNFKHVYVSIKLINYEISTILLPSKREWIEMNWNGFRFSEILIHEY